MAAASSASLSSEKEVKQHPYQDLFTPGPTGAYEARQVRTGFYVRVDMPGVPQDGVKLYKYSDTRTVTFTGKAPKQWECDSSDRVYVVLDRDPNEVDVEMSVINGSLKLFFPGAEGSLHTLPSRKTRVFYQQQEEYVDPSVVFGDAQECSHDNNANFMDDSPGVTKYRLHSINCSCCKVDPKKKGPSASRNIITSHINPYLVDGVEGVIENKLVVVAAGERMYLRVDLPGLGDNKCTVTIKDGTHMFYGGTGRKEHRLDEGGRNYLTSFMLRCTCCKIVGVTHEMKHGVFRALIRKLAIQNIK